MFVLLEVANDALGMGLLFVEGILTFESIIKNYILTALNRPTILLTSYG